MAKKRFVTEKRYEVNCIRDGFCYATHTNCDWRAVKSFRAIAKALGETITYENTHTVKYEY